MNDVAIRDAQLTDVATIVKVHERAFPTEFLTSLGPQFLTWYYKHAIRSSTSVCFVAVQGPQVVGFVCGSHDLAEADQSLLQQNADSLKAALSIITRRPQKLVALAKRFLWLRTERGELVPCDIELASLCADPDAQGKGVGRKLVQAFAREAESLGCETISLTTNEHGNDNVRRFYEKLGFELVGRFERDRPMVQFTAASAVLS